MASDSFHTYDDEGIIDFNYVLSVANPQNIVVTYKAGYADANLPLALQLIVWQLVGRYYKEIKKGWWGVENRTEGSMGATISFSPRDLNKEQRDILEKYKNRGYSE